MLPKHNLVLTDTLRVSAFSKRLLESGIEKENTMGDVLQAGSWEEGFLSDQGLYVLAVSWLERQRTASRLIGPCWGGEGVYRLPGW